jgi:hypothetical protein
MTTDAEHQEISDATIYGWSRPDAIIYTKEPSDPFAKLPGLAARLGVEPMKAGAAPGVSLHMRDGRAYDVFDLINAFLDQVTPKA